MLSEARVQEEKQGRPEISYFRYLGAAFGTIDLLAKLALFTPLDERGGSDEGAFTFNRHRNELLKIIHKSVGRAKLLLESVIEYTGDNLEGLRSSGTQIAGRGCEPLLAQPVKIFANYSKVVNDNAPAARGVTQSATRGGFEERFSKLQGVEDRHIPMVPLSRLFRMQLAVLYQAQLLLQRLVELEDKPAKEQANAVFLACLEHNLDDLEKVMQRKLELEKSMLDVQQLEMRNEFMSPEAIAEQLYLVGRAAWRRLCPSDVPLSGMQAHGSVVPIVDWHYFLVRWAQREVILGEGPRERAHNIIYLLGIVDALIENHGDYAAAGAISRALNSDDIGQLRQTVRLLPQRAVARLETLVKITGSDGRYARCREAVSKHRHPLPPMLMVLADARRTDDIRLQKENVQLVERVIRYSLQAAEKNQAAVRLDVQHWLLARPFLNDRQVATMIELREPTGKIDLTALDAQPEPEAACEVSGKEPEERESDIRAVDKSDLGYADPIVPRPRQRDLEALAAVDTDRIDIVIGQLRQ